VDEDPEVSEVSKAEFRSAVLESPVPVLVDFHATWCGPCAWLDPVLTELARKAGGRYRVVKVDVDGAPELARRYRIGSVPTVVLLRNGEEVDRSVGVEPQRLRAMLEVE